MLLGTVLMLIGIVLVSTNKKVAVMTGTTRQPHFNGFWDSAARQNIAIIGFLLAIAGFSAFLFL